MYPEENTLILTFIIGTIMVLFTSITLFLFFILYQKRKFKFTREKQQLKTNFQQELLHTQLEIQEQIFQNISQEVHDNIGQMLSLVKLNLNTIDMSKPDILEQKIHRSKELVSKVITDLRDLSKSLNPEIIRKIGLSEAIQQELLIVAKTGQYEANLSELGDFYQFDPQKELIIYRIFQEIINNIIKHSRARTVNVVLEYQPQVFTLTVSDDGEGFNTKQEPDNHHLGLGIRNMRNRAKLIGAEFKITSMIDEGTIISVELPLPG
jgi:signal transduction histidine kinase